MEAYKCFRFNDGTVASYDGNHGIMASCDIPFTCSIYADEFLRYLKACDTETIEFRLKDNRLHVRGASFPILADDDFPEIVPEGDHKTIFQGSGFGEAISSIVYCIDKAATRKNIPAAVYLQDCNLYASDSIRAARYPLDGLEPDAKAVIPVSACKLIEKLGEPDEVTGDDKSLALYFGGLCLIVRLIDKAPAIAKAIDAKLEQMEAVQKLSDAPNALSHLKRLQTLTSEDVVGVIWNPKLNTWVFNVASQESGNVGQELVSHELTLPSLGFRVSLEGLIEAFAKGPIMMDWSDVTTGGGGQALRFIYPNYQQLLALRSQ